MKTTEQILEAVVKHIAVHAFRESILLTPRPGTLVEAYGVLDIIRDEGCVEPETIDRWLREACEAHDAKK